ncbi:MAG: hypothetical protein Sapg2KO_13360 [Saprospiraceae bacterium]
MANKNDSALSLLGPFFDQADPFNSFELSTQLELQYLYGKALQQDNQDTKAILLLKALQKQSQAIDEWLIFVKASLELAELYEKIYRANDAKVQLQRAKAVIDEYQLDALRTEWRIRTAYWHHDFGYPDSTSFYTQRVLKDLNPGSNLQNKLDAYTLMGHSVRDEDFRQGITYYKVAVEAAKALKNYTALSKLYDDITFINNSNTRWDEGWKYVDSTIAACYQAITAGHENINILGDAYRRKALIFETRGQYDSAYYYIERGYAQNIRFLEQQQFEQIVEIDAQYEDQQKDLRLDQQNQEIRQGRQIRYLLMGIIVLILAMIVVVIKSYFSQRRINEKIKEQSAQLQKVDEIKSRFFTNVSHELRTPLTLIMGPLQSMQNQQLLNEQQGKLIALAYRNSKQLEQLVNEILDLQKLSANQLQLQTQPTEIAAFFRLHLGQFESLANFKAIDYTYQVDIPKQQKALIDREKCRQIVYNLLSNAFKFTLQKGSVGIKVFLQQHVLHVQVEDTGSGIPAKDLPYIFDRYFQSRTANASASGGTGIGLAICKEYVDLMNGEIEVQSQLEHGTTFSLHFPIQLVESQSAQLHFEPAVLAQQATSKQVVSTNTTAPSRPKKRLLLVEDNPELQLYIRLLLADQYELSTAQNGQEALEILAQSTDFHLILSDLMMPIMDGYQLLKKLKSQDDTRHIPTIILTAKADMGSKLQALRIGVDDYLSKPFHEQELKMRIAHLIQNQANRTPETASSREPTDAMQTNADQAWLIQLEAIVQQNLNNELLTVTFLATKLAMSKSSLLRQLKRLTGLSPSQYILEARLQKARQLIESNSLSYISEVAQAVGYANAKSFSRSFKKRFGETPSDF